MGLCRSKKATCRSGSRSARRLCARQEPANIPPAVDIPALTRWLADAFDSVELRYVVRMGPEGEAMAGFLPGENCSPAQLCLSVAEGWQRRGVLGPTLRDHLLAERPSRGAEVKALFKKNRVFGRERSLGTC